MSPFNVVLITSLCLAVLLLLLALLALPGIRLHQVARYLRGLLNTDDAEPKLPRSLNQIGAELMAVRNRLNEQGEEVRLQIRRRQDLIAFLAHDLKTPLTSVLGYLELLRDEPGLSEEQRVKYIGIALNKAKRLEELIGEFFDINTAELKLEKRDKVQVSFLLEQLADEFYPLFAAKGLECTPEIEPHLVVEGDSDKLARVFENVLRNAVNYSAPDKPVGLSAKRKGEKAVVAITNEGLEIPERELTNIFEKFYRLDAARSTRTGGAGLGLAIAKEIVEFHGGTIHAESTGKLTTFVVELPLAK